MTQSGQSIVNLMLGWLKGLAAWVLRLFNLSGGFSPLRFLADHWLVLLLVLLAVGLSADLLIWLVRWRPHWVWFRKKRIIINDKDFFAGEDEIDERDEAEDWDLRPQYKRRVRQDPTKLDWYDNDYVVASAAHRKREQERQQREREAQQRRAARVETDVFTDENFDIRAEHQVSDRYEDEVFRVNDLPLQAPPPAPAPGQRASAAPSRPSGNASRQGAKKKQGSRA